MAGGFGKRFWPLSVENHPKQFIDVLGKGESMLQTTFHRFEKICPRENIIIVTGEQYADKVREQLPGLADYQVLKEPARRNTAPCIAYGATVIEKMNPNANIVVTPSDHAIFGEERFIKNINDAIAVAESHDWIITIGVRPTSPNPKYGYIQFSDKSALSEMKHLHKVKTFTEKPMVEMARNFIASGEFFWNSGIFVWRLPVLKAAYESYLPLVAKSFEPLSAASSAEEVEAVYSQCEPASADFAIMEKASNGYVMEASFGWSDVETWDSLYNTCQKDANGNVFANGKIFAYDTKNCVVNMSSNGILVLQGLDGYVVAGNDRVMMVCRRDQENNIVKFSSDVELYEMLNEQLYKSNKQ